MNEVIKVCIGIVVGVLVGIGSTVAYAKYAYTKSIKAEVKGGNNGNK